MKEDSEVEKLIQMIDDALRIAGNRAFKIRPSIRANAFSNASTYYHLQGHDKHAIPYMQKALDIFYASIILEDGDQVAYAITLSNAARLKVGLRLFSEAEQLYTEAIKIKEKVLPRDHHSLYRTVMNLANLYEHHMGQPNKANSLRKKYLSAFADNPWRQV
jgi:tetratricopeptide (TPR) repeat protein